jgi:hypothetical protein
MMTLVELFGDHANIDIKELMNPSHVARNVMWRGALMNALYELYLPKYKNKSACLSAIGKTFKRTRLTTYHCIKRFNELAAIYADYTEAKKTVNEFIEWKIVNSE